MIGIRISQIWLGPGLVLAMLAVGFHCACMSVYLFFFLSVVVLGGVHRGVDRLIPIHIIKHPPGGS